MINLGMKIAAELYSLEEKVMAYQTSNDIASSIDSQLNDLSSTPLEQCLFKVPNHLQRVKKECYEPDIVAIGPYHHDKNHLQGMKEHKLRYLQVLLQRRNENSVMRYVQALTNLEQRARQCYAEPISLERGKFVEMMLLDGCFVVELIRKGAMEDLRSDDDLLFKLEMVLYSLKHDLLLLENQLPFFVLKELFDMTLMPNQESNFIQLILSFFRVFPGPGFKRIDQHAFQNIQHLLGLLHDNWLPSPIGMKAYAEEKGTQSSKCLILWLSKGSKDKKDTPSHIRCAIKLKEAGIKFKRVEDCSMFDIKFENAILLIPKLTIEDRTESLLRNLIAYEQLSKKSKDPHHVMDYAMFMDCLINTEKDVELLCRCGIIDNWLGDDEVVAALFNKLLDHVRLYHEKSYYADTYEKLNKHCSRQWNVWKAKLRHDYFNSPWALISFLAAFLLLSLALIQTLYTVLSYYKP